ncbi:uncharacterized protein EDB91DRAFT_1340047 [Suillus paluster]|uniref:uncharacterized protein n=1 Tax=Suillus paluster TaxID=48578 RepID=UPI001B8797AB|nr:uncharacterized protein EDB91DRAFT_1340047 [Suillus paluster]KAG1724642.1 hypothetical protein EDB91DRAFT_1340047 [Suillus paluster]
MTYVVEARTRCPRLFSLMGAAICFGMCKELTVVMVGESGLIPEPKLAPVSPERHPVFHLTRDRNAYECNSRAAARFQITLQYLDNVTISSVLVSVRPIPAMFSIAFAKSSRDLQKSEMGKEHDSGDNHVLWCHGFTIANMAKARQMKKKMRVTQARGLDKAKRARKGTLNFLVTVRKLVPPKVEFTSLFGEETTYAAALQAL